MRWNHLIFEASCGRKFVRLKSSSKRPPQKPSYCKDKICITCWEKACPFLLMCNADKEDYHMFFKAWFGEDIIMAKEHKEKKNKYIRANLILAGCEDHPEGCVIKFSKEKPDAAEGRTDAVVYYDSNGKICQIEFYEGLGIITDYFSVDDVLYKAEIQKQGKYYVATESITGCKVKDEDMKYVVDLLRNEVEDYKIKKESKDE